MTHRILDKSTGNTILDLGGGFSVRTYRLPDGALHVVAVGAQHPATSCASVEAGREWRG